MLAGKWWRFVSQHFRDLKCWKFRFGIWEFLVDHLHFCKCHDSGSLMLCINSWDVRENPNSFETIFIIGKLRIAQVGTYGTVRVPRLSKIMEAGISKLSHLKLWNIGTSKLRSFYFWHLGILELGMSDSRVLGNLEIAKLRSDEMKKGTNTRRREGTTRWRNEEHQNWRNDDMKK